MATVLEVPRQHNGARRFHRDQPDMELDATSETEQEGVDLEAIIPHGRVTGLSKLARVVEEVAKRPQVQERMTQTVADLIERELETTGVAVVVQAEHSCLSIRGVKKHGSSTITSALRGIFKTNPASRAEVLSLIGQKAL